MHAVSLLCPPLYVFGGHCSAKPVAGTILYPGRVTAAGTPQQAWGRCGGQHYCLALVYAATCSQTLIYQGVTCLGKCASYSLEYLGVV
jgi:hypothetical protein